MDKGIGLAYRDPVTGTFFRTKIHFIKHVTASGRGGPGKMLY